MSGGGRHASVTVTNNPRNFPCVTDLFPNHDKRKIAAVVCVVLFVTEAMCADLNRAEVFDRINLQRALGQVTPDIWSVVEHPGESFAGLLVIG